MIKSWLNMETHYGSWLMTNQTCITIVKMQTSCLNRPWVDDQPFLWIDNLAFDHGTMAYMTYTSGSAMAAYVHLNAC